MDLPEEDEGWWLLGRQPCAQERGHAQGDCLLSEGSEGCPGVGRNKLRPPPGLTREMHQTGREGWEFGQYLGNVLLFLEIFLCIRQLLTWC